MSEWDETTWMPWSHTFCQGMDAQPNRWEIPLPDLPAQLIEANPSAKHQVIDNPLVVRHVVDKPLKRWLSHPLGFC